MKRRPQLTIALPALAAALLLGLSSIGFAQGDGWPVTLIMRDGSQASFTIHLYSRDLPAVLYPDGDTSEWGIFVAKVGGIGTPIPFSEISRADLVASGEQRLWRATLKDGRVFDGMVLDRGKASLAVIGRNQFGTEEVLVSDALDPYRQPFIGIIFDPDAVAPGEATAQQPAARADVDSVTLRNGDVLSGTILTGEFTVQASYGTLTFTSEQLASITIEDAAGKTDQFVLQVGDRVSGVLQNTTIEMTLTTGATITLEKGNIASITFATED